MNYYKIVLLNSKAPIFIYHSNSFNLKRGDVVKVPLKNSIKRAIVLEETTQPNFQTQEILEKESFFYSHEQLNTAQFISNYYFSSFGEAIGTFYPHLYNKIDLNSINIDSLPTLSSLQEKVLKELDSKETSLLFGVTGSGKTEIYIHLIAKVLRNKQSAIILMPEIALTPQITKRLNRFFGNCVATWHSKLTNKKREEILNKIQKGDIRVVIGARSALFLPMHNLGIIIVDEAHDDSYKSMKRPRYNAKDLSIYIGKKFKIKVILGSATPLVSDYYKFDVVKLKKPFIESKKEYLFLAGEEIDFNILKEIKSALRKNQQTLIFVPTRANFKYLVCNICGKTHLCPFCSIGMSIHSKKRILKCHYCNFISKIPNRCEYCGSEDLISNRVGTAEIAELIENEIEEAKVIIFDKDNITTTNKLYKAIEKIYKKEANVIIGTQMLSKGHDYPEITLIVITGLDFILAVGDYRSKERAISLFHQIAGRGGRAKDAKILIKSSQKDFYEKYIKDYEIFIKEELEFRKELYPPFKNLARVLIANKNYNKALDILNEALNILKKFDFIEIVGKGLSPIEKIANKWRFFILVRSSKKTDILKALNVIKELDLEIDMDPVDFS